MIHVSIVLKASGFIGLRGLLFGAVLGAAFGTLLASLIGTIYGALFGAIVGLLLGALGGLVIGMVTAVFFDPVLNAQTYRWAVRLLGGGIGLGGGLVGFGLLLSPSSLTLHEWLTDGIPYIVIPTLIAAGCAIYVSNGYAGRYLSEKHEKRIID